MKLIEITQNVSELDIRALGNAIRSISKMNPDQEAQNVASWLIHKKLPQAVRDKKDQETIRKIEKRQKAGSQRDFTDRPRRRTR